MTLTANGRTIDLPKQPPTKENMAELMGGMLLEVEGCPGPYWGVNSVSKIP